MNAEELMRRVIAGFESADLEPLIAALHDNVVWKSASKQDMVFRFGGDYCTKLGVLDALSDILMDYTINQMRPREIVAAGDVVWGLFDVELEVAIRWRLKDEKIIEHQAFFDTASLLIQQGHPPGH